MIDNYTGRGNGAYEVTANTVQYFDGNGKERLQINELADAPAYVGVSTTGSITDFEELDSADYMLYPLNAHKLGRPYTEIVLDTVNGSGLVSVFYDYPKAVKIQGKWGYSTVAPGLVKQVATIQVCRWYERAKANFYDQGAWMYARELDPDVKVMLASLRRSPL